MIVKCLQEVFWPNFDFFETYEQVSVHFTLNSAQCRLILMVVEVFEFWSTMKVSKIPKEIIKLTLMLFFLPPIIHSVKEKNIAKVICSLSHFNEVDILKGIFGDPLKLGKYLQKECNIKFRFVKPNVTKLGRKDIIVFSSHNMENKKETLWPFEIKILNQKR